MNENQIAPGMQSGNHLVLVIIKN